MQTSCTKMLADIFTPVSIYLRLRDRFRDTVLLESTDYHAADNSYSFIGINAIGGIEIKSDKQVEQKFPGREPEKMELAKDADIAGLLWAYMQQFEITGSALPVAKFAQGLYGYTSFDAVNFFEKLDNSIELPEIPLMRYRLYQYVIVINHFKNELFICENIMTGLETEREIILSLIRSKDVPEYPFACKENETAFSTEEEFLENVRKGIAACHRGDVYQLVLSRRFQQKFTGDELNVYRQLRSVNPSPYLFYFDYGDYKLMGSSPETHLKIENGEAILHPIAGTYKRTGDDKADQEAAINLLQDQKENAEHVMLVDLARNDLSRLCSDVTVSAYRQIQYFSHVIHIVSEVKGKFEKGNNPVDLLVKTFPAGTLSGAPKHKALQLIQAIEKTSRSFYGGAIGFFGCDGSCNHAIMIRTFLSQQNTLTYQAGAGIVADSQPEVELQEVNHKLGALKKAIQLAGAMHTEKMEEVKQVQ